MTDLNREFTRMRIDHLATLMEQISYDIRPTLERAMEQCRNLDAAADALRAQIADLDDAEEVERLAGGPVRRVA